jgi:Putative zinc-finger
MKEHLEFPALADYWFGELEPQREQALEEHLFSCAHCSARLEALSAIGAGIRATFRSGMLHAVLPRAFVEGLKRDGLRLREYRVAAGGSVNCTITTEDDFVISRLQAPLAGVERLDLVVGPATYEDIPFDPAAGEVLVCPSPAVLRPRAAYTERMRLFAVRADGRKQIGEYTFVHTPG